VGLMNQRLQLLPHFFGETECREGAKGGLAPQQAQDHFFALKTPRRGDAEIDLPFFAAVLFIDFGRKASVLGLPFFSDVQRAKHLADVDD